MVLKSLHKKYQLEELNEGLIFQLLLIMFVSPIKNELTILIALFNLLLDKIVIYFIHLT